MTDRRDASNLAKLHPELVNWTLQCGYLTRCMKAISAIWCVHAWRRCARCVRLANNCPGFPAAS